MPEIAAPYSRMKPGWSRTPRTVLLGPAVAVALVTAAWVIPKVTADPFVLSFVPTTLVMMLAALHVWLLLRVDLLSFAAPAFMAVGGYTLALVAMNLTTNAIALVALCFLIPAAIALPLGLVLLRLRGTYFALVTFVFAQVVTLIIIIAEGPLGGSSGISGIPPASLGGTDFGAEGDLVRFSVIVGVVGVLVASVVSVRWRRHFASIDENEPLARSLGLRPWFYKTIAFVSASGVAGLAGLVLINQLGNTHPDSFLPLSAVNYLAAAVIGGTSIIGPVIGALLLAWLIHTFASQAQMSQLFLGTALIVMTLFAKKGLTGLVADGYAFLNSAMSSRRSKDVVAVDVDKSAVPPADVPTTSESQPEPPSPAGDPILSVKGLSKRFGGVAAVDGISFDLQRGEILGVIGPNGAGKTTLINMVAGAMPPTSGRVGLHDHDLTGSSPQEMSRRGIARSYQQTSVFSSASVRENLARGKAFSRRWIGDDDLQVLLALTGLDAHLDERAGDMPYGLQKLLGLVLPLATDPDVVLFDEPAAGLEMSERTRVDELVQWAVERGCAVLLVEHDMDLVRRVCRRLLVMDTGTELAAGEPAEVLARSEVVTAYLGVPDDVADLEDGPTSSSPSSSTLEV